jgi:hypothetical protein
MVSWTRHPGALGKLFISNVNVPVSGPPEMKLIIAALYTNYTSHIVDDEGMENQSDGYTGRPENEQLFLRFEKVV